MPREKDQETLEAEALAYILGSERIVGFGRASGDQPRKCPGLPQSPHLKMFEVWDGKPNLCPQRDGWSFLHVWVCRKQLWVLYCSQLVFMSPSPVGCGRTGEVPPCQPFPPAESFQRAAKGAWTHFTPLINPGIVLSWKAIRPVLWCNFMESSGEPSPCHPYCLHHAPLPPLFSVSPSCSVCIHSSL